jgi:hypothetical protein
MEKWIKTYCSDNYEVSSLGRVRSLDRLSSNNKLYKGRYKKQNLSKNGYLRTSITINGKTKIHLVHQLVYYSFNGGEPNGHTLVIDHIDSNKQNNTLNNLQAISSYENTMKGYRVKHDLPKYVSAKLRYKSDTVLSYFYQRNINGKRTNLKTSNNLEDVLEFKKQYENKGI